MEEDLDSFLSHWYEGYVNGLLLLDETQQEALLACCGRACAASYSAGQFQLAWQNAGGEVNRFRENLAQRFPEAKYEGIAENEIRVIYTHCSCDLVRNGWMETPLLCRCSTHNLKANFESVLGRNVKVELFESILAGNKQCRFHVSW